MKLARLTRKSDGKAIFVNPVYVLTVEPLGTGQGSSIKVASPSILRATAGAVEETPAQAAAIINEALA